jgi:hypothetical protein
MFGLSSVRTPSMEREGATHRPRPSVRQARSVAILTDIDISTIEGSQADISTGEEG